MGSLGKCGCGHLASGEEMDQNGGECEDCARLRKLGNGNILEGERIEKERKSLPRKKAKFDSDITMIYVSITPKVGNCIALPIPTEKQSKDEYIQNSDWRGIVELVCKEVDKESGISCQNAMYMIASCIFEVQLQDNETPEQAEKRTKKAFITAWNKIVDNVKPGKSLTD